MKATKRDIRMLNGLLKDGVNFNYDPDMEILNLEFNGYYFVWAFNKGILNTPHIKDDSEGGMYYVGQKTVKLDKYITQDATGKNDFYMGLCYITDVVIDIDIYLWKLLTNVLCPAKSGA